MTAAPYKPSLQCPQCGYTGSDYHLIEKGQHTGAYCSECAAWIKWLSKEDKHRTKEKEKEVWEKTGGHCCYCGVKLNPFEKDYTHEHIVSRKQGGSNKIDNLMPCCKSCNSSKGGDKDIEDFRKHIIERDGLEYYIFHFEVIQYGPKHIKEWLKQITIGRK